MHTCEVLVMHTCEVLHLVRYTPGLNMCAVLALCVMQMHSNVMEGVKHEYVMQARSSQVAQQEPATNH